MAEKRSARLPKYRPKPLGNGDEFLDRVSLNGVKTYKTFTEDIYPEISVVQTGRSARRQPKDMYGIPSRVPFESQIALIPKGKKWCSACGDWVDAKGFSADGRNRDGLQSHCKSCRNEHARKMYWAVKHTAIEKAA